MGLARFFGQELVTPEGYRVRVTADDLNQKMSSTSGNGGSKPPSRAEMERELVSDPDPFEKAQNITQIESALKMISKRNDASIRKKGVQVLMANEELAIETLSRQLREKGLSGPDTAKAVDRNFLEVRRIHFESMNEKNLHMVNRLAFLVGELRRAYRRVHSVERVEVGALLDSVELKQWEMERIYAEGNDVLAKSSGEKKEVEFSSANYAELRRQYEESYKKMEEYLARHPDFEKLLINYRDPGTEDTPLTLKAVDLHSLITHLGVSLESRGYFQDTLEFDPFLATDSFRPLYRTLKQLQGGLKPSAYLDTLQPLQDYLEGLKLIRAWISREDLKAIKVAKFLNSPEGEPQSLDGLRRQLSEKIQQRWNETKKSTKRAGDLEASNQALEIYLEKLRGLLDLLHNQRTLEPFLPTLKWEEVKSRLKDKVKQGMVHPNAADQLLQWLEGAEGHPKDPILSQYRNEFVAGMLEFFFNESRTLREKERLSNFLAEICHRQDISMMRNLAGRFHTYQRGKETRNPSSGKPAKTSKAKEENGNGRHEALKMALLEMSEVYEKHPNFQGPYFEILEKIHDTSQLHSLRLTAPIYLRIQGLLRDGIPVKLLAHPSLGLELLQVEKRRGGTRLEAVTSIQENLDSKATFNKWMEKVVTEVEKKYEEPYRISVFIPRMRSDSVRRDALTWARDFLETHPFITKIELSVPTTERGKVIRRKEISDHLDASQYAQLVVDRRISTTRDKIEIFRSEIKSEPFDVVRHLAFYQLLRESEPSVTLESEAFHTLLEARRHFPENPTVAAEMWRVLDENNRTLKILSHDQLSDFHPAEIERNKQNLLQLGLNTEDLGLGSDGHFRRLGLFIEAILGKPLPTLNLKEVFDLSPLGYETKNWHFTYNPKKPHRFTLRADIPPAETGKSRFSRPPGFLKKEGERHGIEEGFLTLRIEGKSSLGDIRLVIQNLKPPMGHSGNGVGTLLVERLITLGRRVGASALVFRNVENSGKYALFKMGGRPDKNWWNLANHLFPSFVDEKVGELKLFGIDTSAASSIKTPQEMAEAYLDPIKRNLTLYPRWDRREKDSDIFFVDPAAESPYQVGRQFFLERPVQDWEVIFELKPDSPEVENFWKYYRYRFDLAEGEILTKIPPGSVDPEGPSQD